MSDPRPDRARRRALPGGLRLRRQIWLSALALAWERLWPALWPAMATMGAFAVASLLGLWEVAPPWLHAVLLALFVAAFAAALWRARGAARPPGLEEAVRRLERESGVGHRPLSAMLDTPAGDAAGGETAGRRRDALWAAHRRRAVGFLRRLRVAWPRPALAARDPWALRGLLVLALAVSAAVAGDRAGDRFAAALAFADETPPAPPGRLTAWIDPPPHTGLAPVFLTPPAGVAPGASPPSGAHEVVAGSLLNAHVFGGAGAPVLAAGAAREAFERAGAGNFALRRELGADTEARIVQAGRELGAWRLSVIADAPPTVELGGEPEATRRGVLRLRYAAADDFGLDSVAARIHRGGADDAWPLAFALPLPGLAPTEARESSYHDLTAHPWAGSAVTLELAAIDNAGQEGRAAGFRMTLPERPFAHPVAIEIVALRRALALDRDTAEAAHEGLGAIMDATEAFSGDVVAFLGLAAARTRLELVEDRADIRPVVDLLWDVALRIEDGALALAEQELRAAQEELREALADGAPPEELTELMDRLRESLDRYLEMLAQSGREREMEEQDEDIGFNPGSLRRSRDDLQQMIDNARDLAETGARDAARDMLEQLQELLENMEPARPEENPAAAGGERMMQQLQEIMEGQDELLDETFRRAQQGGENERQTPGGDERTAAERQEALRRALGEVMRRLGEGGEPIPQPLGRAERSMQEAREELERARPDRAAEAQAEALAALQQGAEAVMNQLMAGETGQRPGRDGNPRDGVRDPLGRLPPGNNGDPGGFVEVPTGAAVQRSREIRDELRRRAGERARTRTDIDYIRRLLDMY